MILGSASGQTIEEFYLNIPKEKGWKTKLTHSSNFKAFSEDYKVGVIEFNSDNRLVVFMVFEKDALEDSVFQFQYKQWNTLSSCRNFNRTEPFEIGTFTTTDLLIIPKHCPKCDFERDRRCKQLAKTIWGLNK